MQSGEAKKPWLTAWRSGDIGAECPTCGKGLGRGDPEAFSLFPV